MEYFLNKGAGDGGSVIPKLYVKFWWPLFLALKTRLFLAKSDIFIPRCNEGGSTGLGNIPKKNTISFSASLMQDNLMHRRKARAPHQSDILGTKG